MSNWLGNIELSSDSDDSLNASVWSMSVKQSREVDRLVLEAESLAEYLLEILRLASREDQTESDDSALEQAFIWDSGLQTTRV